MVPDPFSELNDIVPPDISIIFFVIAKPSPIPVFLVVKFKYKELVVKLMINACSIVLNFYFYMTSGVGKQDVYLSEFILRNGLNRILE